MIKVLQFIALVVFWLQAFIVPVLLCGFIAFVIYSNNKNNAWLAIIVVGIGVISGGFLAEFIRRRYGLLTFFSRINGPNEIDEK